MPVVGNLTARFRLDSKQAEKGAANLRKTFGAKLGRSMEGLAGRAGALGSSLSALGPAGIAAGAGVAALVGAAVKGLTHITRLGDQITTLSSKTGLSTDFLQKLRFATKKLDVPFETAARSVSRLQVNIGKLRPTRETLDALQQLGLSIDDLRTMGAEEQFNAIADAIKRLKDPSEQAAAAQALLGRSGIELLPLLRGNYAELIETAERLGFVLDQELLEAGDDLAENWELLKELGVVMIAEAIGPMVEDMARLSDTMLKNANSVRDWAGRIAAALIPATALKQVIDKTVGAYTSLITKLQELGQIPEFASQQRSRDIAIMARLHQRIVRGRQKEVEVIDEATLAQRRLRQAVVGVGNELKSVLDVQVGIVEAAKKTATTTSLILRPGAAEADLFGRPEEFALPGFGEDIPGGPAGRIEPIVEGYGDIADSVETVRERQKEFNEQINEAIGLVDLLPGKFGSVADSIISSIGGIQRMGGALSGLSESVSGLGQVGGALGKFGGKLAGGLAAVGQFAGPVGAAISAGIQIGAPIVKGIGKALGIGKKSDLVKDAARDLGATISREMETELRKQGKNIQLAVGEIFEKGGFESVDRFAEEVGDIFSGLQQQLFTEPEAITALEEAVPQLLANLDELGPAGEAQIERIIQSARDMGIEFEGLSDLIGATLTDERLEALGLAGVTNVNIIRQAAQELGVEFDVLFEKIQGTFAPQTVEEMAEAFGLTNDEVRALADNLGINVQTNLEKLAASVGLTAEDFKALGAAMEAQLGIPAEQLLEFLEATGLSADELAEKLGVEVAGGVGALGDETGAAQENVEGAADAASRLADELERAARAADGIDFPAGDGGIPGMQRGGIVRRPTVALVGEAGPEVVTPVAALFGQFADTVAARIGRLEGSAASSDPQLRSLLANLPNMVGRAVRDNIQRATIGP